jgi:hypothetical protein
VRIQWIHSIAQKAGLIGAALLTVSALISCGGGGVATNTPVATGPLTVLPNTVDVFPNTPVTFTISGGTPGYSVFSGNSTVIPLNSQVSGSTFTVIANDVIADIPVTITVRDAANATAPITANVKLAVLNNLATLTPLAPLAGCPPEAVCSGGDANVTVTAIQNNIKLINRPILFTVIQGQFQFVTPNSFALVSSITINTDENGLAVVKLRVPATVPTQVATLTMTDTTTGLVKYFNFNIVQQTSGAGILSALPSGDTTFTGAAGAQGFSPAAEGTCPVGFVDYYIFGGTPPYRIASPLPSLVLVGVPGGTFAAETILTTNGGSFVATIFGCGQTQLIVTDATNRSIETSQIIGVRGAPGTPAVVPVVTIPAVSPAGLTFTACSQSGTVNLSGTGSWAGTVATPGGSPGISITPSSGTLPQTVTVTRVSNPVPQSATPGTVLVNFGNSAGTGVLQVTNSAGANCIPASPASVTVAVAATTTSTISGGVTPYTPTSSNPAVATATVTVLGVVTITGVAIGTATITVTDSAGNTAKIAVTVL